MKDLFSLLVIGLIVILFSSCARWDLLGPNEDIILLNVQVHFDFENQEIEIQNQNWNSAHVQISRRVSGYEYLEIYDGHVGRGKIKTISAFFSRGNKMKLTVRVRNDENELLEATTYFQLN